MRSLVVCLLLWSCLAWAGAAVVVVPPASNGVSAERLVVAGNAQDLRFPAFSEQVRIELTFEAARAVTGVRLTAQGVPAQNYLSAVVEGQGEGEGAAWAVGGEIAPPAAGDEDGVYTAEGRVTWAHPVRRLRITLHPPYIELPMTLRSLEVLDGQPVAEAAAPAVSGAAAPALVLRQPEAAAAVEIDPGCGEIRRVLAADGRVLVEAIQSEYWVLRQTGGDAQAGAGLDRVVRLEQPQPGEAVFECRAGFDAAVRVVKRYRLGPDGLSKTTQFRRESGAGLMFVTVRDRMVFPAERRSGLVLSGGDPWYSPRIRLETIKARAPQVGSGGSHAVLAMDPGVSGATVAYFRYAVNGRFVWPLSSAYHHEAGSTLEYYPDGVAVPLATLPLRVGEEASGEMRLMVFAGDELAFMERYLQCPEVARRYGALHRPAWLGGVRAQLWLRSELRGDAVAKARQFLELTASGDIMVVLNQPFIWGDYGEAPRFQNIWGAWIQEADYVQLVHDLKALSPRVKVALYTWVWSVARESRFFQEHPEGFLQLGRNGRPFNGFPALPPTILRKFGNRPAVAALERQYEEMFRKYGVDYVYLDGGKGGASMIDWQTGDLDQDYDCQEFYDFLRKTAARLGQGGVCFNSKGNPTADAGIAEMALDGFRNNPALVASRVWGGKLQERLDPLHRVVPCYWGHSDPYYSNICIGLGLLPHVELSGLSLNEDDFMVRKLPMLTVMREMLGTRPVGLVAGSALEALSASALGFELERGGARMASLIDHADAPAPFALRFAGDFRGEYAWQNDLDDPTRAVPVFTEPQQVSAWRGQSWKLQQSVRTAFRGELSGAPLQIQLRSKLLTLMTASRSAGVILAVDGLPCQLRLSAQPGAEILAQAEGGRLAGEVRLTGGVSEADVAVLLPLGQAPQAVTGAQFTGLFLNQTRAFLMLKSAGGPFAVTLQPAPKTATLALVLERSAARPGETVAFRIEGGDPPAYSAVDVYADWRLLAAVPVTGGRGELRLPELLRDGGYLLRLETPGGVVGTASLTVAGATPVPLPRPAPPARPKARLTAVAGVTGVLGVAMGGGGEEQVELAPLVFTAKLPEWPKSLGNYSAAGVEFQRVRYLRFDAESDIATRYCIEKRRSWGPAMAGVLVDYAVGGRYVQRVAFDCGMGGEYRWALPEFGTGRIPDRQVRLGSWVAREPKQLFSLDLGRYAPPGWQGQAIVCAALSNVLQGRCLKLRLVQHSWDDAGVLLPEDAAPAPAAALPKFPAALAIPPGGQAATTDFREPETLKPIDLETRATLRWDAGRLVIRMECAETDLAGLATVGGVSGQPHYDDSVEVHWLDPATGRLAQVVVNSAGVGLTRGGDGQPMTAVEYSAQVKPAEGKYCVSIAVPQALLPPGQTLRLNLCRNRPHHAGDSPQRWEYAAWARLPQLKYALPEYFGTVSWSGAAP